MQKTLLTLFLHLMTVATFAATALDRLSFSGHLLSTADGLSSNTVFDIRQSHDGFVWMGTASGLCRYDGYRFASHYALSDANVGHIYEDASHRRLWVHSATFTWACYNELTGRFDDYTGRGDEGRAYQKVLFDKEDVWMYDSYHGVRHVRVGDGRYTCTDYTQENGALPTNHVRRVVRDGAGHVWVLTPKGLVVIGAGGAARLVARGDYQEGNCHRGQLVCLYNRDRVSLYDHKGRMARTIAIPSMMGRIGSVRGNLLWQGRWMLFSKQTYSIDLTSGRCELPDKGQISNGLLLDSIEGYYFVSNAQGHLWMYPPTGMPVELRLMPGARFTAERNRLYSVARGRDGYFYIATYGNGLFVYDSRQGSLRHLTANDDQPVLGTNVLTHIMSGADGSLWVVQESAGVVRLTVTDQSVATVVEPEPGRVGDWGNFVRMIDRGAGGRILFSTRNNRLLEYHPSTATVSVVGETNSCVYSVWVDRRGRTWMATRNDGLYVDNVHYVMGDKEHPVPSRALIDLAEDGQGRVWIATAEDGLLVGETQADGRVRFSTLLNRNSNEGRQRQVVVDKWGRLWVATYNGIYMADTRKGRLTDADFRCFDGQADRKPFSDANCLYVADDGALWVGSKGHGVMRCVLSADGQLVVTAVVDKDHSLASNNVNALQQDGQGRLWVATDNGLSVVYGRDMKVRTFMNGQSFGRNNYTVNASLRLPDGRLLFGSQEGLVLVKPWKMGSERSRSVYRVCITDLAVNGRSVAEDSVVAFAPNVTRSVSLGYAENTLTFYFSSFDYAATGASLYQYYLEGVDKAWRPMTSASSAEYASLRPGTYVFHVRALDGSRWSEQQTLTVVIAQPWYNSLWAWLAYLALGLAAAGYLYHNARERLRLHQQMAVDRQLTEFRLNFFTSMAHEFRTPLAIIQGAVDKLASDGGHSRAAVQTARRGTRRLLRLVNQLMEFRKVNTGNMRLQVEEGDIIPFIQKIYLDFWSLARQKDISISFTPFERHYQVPFDPQMVETIVYNLLSNAVKYAPRNGCVEVTLRHLGDLLVMKVKDDGPGISEQRQQMLFQPFMQGSVSRGGMGIGLYTAHQMALLHHGTLDYQRVGAEGGSVFTLSLPATAGAYADGDYRKLMAVDMPTKAEDDAVQAEEVIRELLPEAYNDVTVMVVEDDPDMMEQIKGELAVYFRVKGCADGESALECVKEVNPALVVCDVMLPGIDGYEVVRRIKTTDATAHLPVVMLTALDDDNHHLRSYKVGADDYMVKPCNFRLLVARAVQLIRKSQEMGRYKEGLGQKEMTESPASKMEKAEADAKTAPQLITSQADKLLKEKMQMFVAQHISEPNFTVDQLGAYLGMGRTSLFQKTKSLMGMSPNKYIQYERMRIAADLLAEGELTVAEVSYKVGIQDTSYFNKCFKSYYGVVPSKYERKAE